jgi:hypothetical protein
MNADRNAYDELCGYTLLHRDPAFIHQNVVDAFGAQTATEHTKPIRVAFSLAGLLLHIEWGWTGREVQRAHTRLAQRSRVWPTFRLPVERGAMTAVNVMSAPAGTERDRAIDAWCASVWAAYRDVHGDVAALLRHHELDPPRAGI